MQDWQILAVTAIAIIGIVLMIIKLNIDPVISLIVGGAFLGLASGLGVGDTTEVLMRGFGDIMYEVGLLIGWGVLMGALLNEMGAISRLVGGLLKVFGPKGVPYAFGLTLGTALQSIFLDVLLVMSAPLARRMAPSLGRLGKAKMATAMAISLECGIVLMVPGVAAVALAGLLRVPLGEMLIFGLLVIVPTILVSIWIMNVLIDRGFWKPELDELPEPTQRAEETKQEGNGSAVVAGHDSSAPQGQEPREGALVIEHRSFYRERQAPLMLLFTPMLAALVLIASGAFLEMSGVRIAALTFVSTPVIALLIGLLGTLAVARHSIGPARMKKAIASGFSESGQILLLTGAGGSLAAVVSASGMGDLLGQYFSATTFMPLLVVWAMAAVLHIAVGSVSISAITAAGILAPVAGQIGLSPVLIALAAGAGSLFLVHVTSNTFWLLQSMLGQTTRGTLKSCSFGVSVASVVALVFTLVLSIVI